MTYFAAVTCNGDCDAVYDAVVSRDDDQIESTFYSAAYADAQRILQSKLPSEFWTWLEDNDAVREAVLSVTWPVDPEVGIH